MPNRPIRDGLSFRERVYAMVRQVPAGNATSYGDVAALVGAPRAARGVGAALNALDPDTDVPWWRVVNRSGRLTIPVDHGMRALQRTLLQREAVRFRKDGSVDLSACGWKGPDRPPLDLSLQHPLTSEASES